MKSKFKILHYRFQKKVFISVTNRTYLAVIKNGYVVDIACSEKGTKMYSEKDQVSYVSLKEKFDSTKVQAQDLALYTHWPVHTKEFWDLLNET